MTQQAHAWVSGQIARAWGNDRFDVPEPRDQVCLAAEQHDLGMTTYDMDPDLDPETGFPLSFMEMPLERHLAVWRQAPELMRVQDRYAALLVSLHGSALYERREPHTARARVPRRAGGAPARARRGASGPR